MADSNSPGAKSNGKQMCLGAWLMPAGEHKNSPGSSAKADHSGSYCSSPRERIGSDQGSAGRPVGNRTAATASQQWATREAARAGRSHAGKSGGRSVSEQVRSPEDVSIALDKGRVTSAPPTDTSSRPGMATTGEKTDGKDKQAGDRPAGIARLLEDLCAGQRHVVDLVLKGKSVFVTGAAGTGKSFLLKKLRQALALQGKGPQTYVTGTTGKAAVGIGGCTVHSFAGIGLGDQPVEDLLERVSKKPETRGRWRKCSVLVIDEISMMRADLFDKLNVLGQRMRGKWQPFGGIQLILCGDFFQLPPVGIERNSTKFCFEANTWDAAVDQSIVLKQVFRQRDPFFLRILHEMREGRVDAETQRVLQEKVQSTRSAGPRPLAAGAVPGNTLFGAIPSCSDGGNDWNGGDGVREITYTRLFSKSNDVDRVNERELRKLEGESCVFTAVDTGEKAAYIQQLQDNCSAPSRLELKVGAKVQLLRNLDSATQLVNGATGVVTSFEASRDVLYPKIAFDTLEGGTFDAVIYESEFKIELGTRELARRQQLPLRLAWALSVHKSQGMTIPNVTFSTQGTFEYGQAYVALSRASTLDGLRLLDFDPRVVRAHPRVKSFYAGLEKRATGGVSTTITVISRKGPPPPQPGQWLSTRKRRLPSEARSPATASPRHHPVAARRELTAADRQRIAENRVSDVCGGSDELSSETCTTGYIDK